MADNRMPAELLEKFKQKREETKAPSGAELTEKSTVRKRAAAKARKAKEMSAK